MATESPEPLGPTTSHACNEQASLLPGVLRMKAALSFFNDELQRAPLESCNISECDCPLSIDPFLGTLTSCVILTAVVEGPEASLERLRSSLPPSDAKVGFELGCILHRLLE